MSKQRPILLIDADVLCYQMAYSATDKIDWDGDGEQVEVYRPEQVKVKLESFVLGLIERFRADTAILALSARGAQWRKELWPPYKATRKPRPEMWEVARKHIEEGLIDHWPVRCVPRLEGDDLLGIMATGEFKGRSIIVSIDKDMQTLPCRLFLTHKEQLGVRTITEEDASFFHLCQTMAGDTTDEYKGIPRVGMQTAAERLTDPRLLQFCGNDRWKIVKSFFEAAGLTEEDALMNARLAHIMREGDYNFDTHKVKLWTPSRIVPVT